MCKFFIATFGCRCNQADSAAIREGLCRKSHIEKPSYRDADLIVVNSCTVTHRSDQQVRQEVRKLRRENPQARIVVTGCYAERDPQKLAAIPGVNLVVGNADKDHLAEIICDGSDRSYGEIVHSPFNSSCDCMQAQAFRSGGKTRPFIKLQDGCDARCSYCIVPFVRGPGRSARPEDILAEMRGLIERGYQEIVLTGVHLGTYGRKLAQPTSLVDLLAAILRLPGLGRLRLSGIEPMRFSRGIVKLAVENPALAPHFHIPMQSGSDRILRRMRRPYTAKRYLELLEYIHRELPDAGLGTDVLIGFPGETDQDFQTTCELIRQSPLTYLHVFPFSGREGTDAYRMTNPVAPSLIRERARIVREISQEKNLAFRSSFIGRELEAVTLAKEENLGESVVLTGNYIHARVRNSEQAPNRLVKIRIEEAHSSATYANILSPTGS
jgi:threonylcarbamoyladenosine tRNA methylthiotransferase MtaB